MSALVLFACNDARVEPKPAPSATPSASGSAIVITTSEPVVDASVEASTPELPRCFEPKRIVQLGTIKDEKATWDGDLVATGQAKLDPETLLPRTPPPRAHVADVTLLATGERVESHKGHVFAGVRWSRPLRAGESLESVEDERWVVISALNGKPSKRVIDGLSGRVDKRSFIDVLGDRAIVKTEEDSGATVVSILTGRIFRHESACVAGGTFEWSLAPGFLMCTSYRFGSFLFALDGGKDITVDQSTSLSPDNRYLVHRPGVSWGSTLLSPDRVSYERVGGRTITLTKDVPPATEDTPPLSPTVPVAFCGDGALFAIVTRHDLVIHRGKDGARLAAARALPGGAIEFSASGRYVLFKRAGASTVYRLDP
jgi:hypothetical protein